MKFSLIKSRQFNYKQFSIGLGHYKSLNKIAFNNLRIVRRSICLEKVEDTFYSRFKIKGRQN